LRQKIDRPLLFAFRERPPERLGVSFSQLHTLQQDKINYVHFETKALLQKMRK